MTVKHLNDANFVKPKTNYSTHLVTKQRQQMMPIGVIISILLSSLEEQKTSTFKITTISMLRIMNWKKKIRQVMLNFNR
jgi:CRISPR/Cas system CMR-associated protein Cmr5 small subunit